MNSTNNLEKIKYNKWAWFFKKGYAAIAVILLGLIMFLCFGFNKSFDYTGGTIVTVNATTYSEPEAKNKINNVFKNHGNAVICVTNPGKNYDEKEITIKYQISTNIDDTNDKILNELYQEFGYDETDSIQQHYITMVTHIQPAYGSAVFTYALFGALMAVLACAIYIWIRFGFASAATLIATTVIDVLCGLALIVIFRASISANMGYALLTIAILSIMFNTFMLHKLRENSFKEENKKLPNSDVADITARSMFKPYLLLMLVGLVLFLVLSLISGPVTGMSIIAIALTVVAITATALFVNPSLWSLAYVRRIREPKKTEAVEVETTPVIENDEEN